ncbi:MULTISPECIES: cell wall hydrolase [unclassified Ruminococcus]|uniref:cell wall hydrolase n=1 Tax=unclassified Ruminococcus TaxID=2608920 RepID=UPI00210866B0|nr:MULTISPECIES: cell wall hydrolase [unclassified Ruminococcus]MCQ4022126.1 cell wall hydrolase [Ruminococcus sp. zg-924]MCQ4114446.1 cell wall hydrolase [Ruminococcus sp. zg-921]
MAFDTRELFARLIQCEAGGEGEDGMRAVASIIMNRANVGYGEFARVSNGGDVRAIIEQQGQFVCMRTTVGGQYNTQNIYNMNPTDIHYEIVDWALGGNTLSAVGNSLFFFNPYSSTCPKYFPANQIGVIYNKVGKHCFYSPTEKYKLT